MSNPTQHKLKFGIPKGSLQDSTIDLLTHAGFNVSVSSRSYFPSIDDDELDLVMFRAQEMARYVEDGILDGGLTGYDWVRENDADVHEVCELIYAKAQRRPVRWVLAVPEESPVRGPKDLDGGIVATELVNVTRRYFEEHGVKVKVEFSWGATEVKARMLSGIVDVTETGSSLKANNLRIVDTILSSTTRMIANRQAWADPWKREKLTDLGLLLNGAIAAKEKIGLKMNVARADLDRVLKQLPAEKSPTVSALADSDFVAVEVIVDESVQRSLVLELKKAGASGIITYPLNLIIP
ncbi:MAG: ATP phosphoribosyltransferase [Phycisphaerae bacterium]|nr:ATP phosphoribosyltransferase [Phycisphaerae bacterium]